MYRRVEALHPLNRAYRVPFRTIQVGQRDFAQESASLVICFGRGRHRLVGGLADLAALAVHHQIERQPPAMACTGGVVDRSQLQCSPVFLRTPSGRIGQRGGQPSSTRGLPPAEHNASESAVVASLWASS